jgi:hypothetical protein
VGRRLGEREDFHPASPGFGFSESRLDVGQAAFNFADRLVDCFNRGFVSRQGSKGPVQTSYPAAASIAAITAWVSHDHSEAAGSFCG